MGLQGTSRDFKGLQGTSRDFKGLEGTSRDFEGLQGTLLDFKRIQAMHLGTYWAILGFCLKNKLSIVNINRRIYF
jgi:superoxide dismutase